MVGTDKQEELTPTILVGDHLSFERSWPYISTTSEISIYEEHIIMTVGEFYHTYGDDYALTEH